VQPAIEHLARTPFPKRPLNSLSPKILIEQPVHTRFSNHHLPSLNLIVIFDLRVHIVWRNLPQHIHNLKAHTEPPAPRQHRTLALNHKHNHLTKVTTTTSPTTHMWIFRRSNLWVIAEAPLQLHLAAMGKASWGTLHLRGQGAIVTAFMGRALD